MYDAHNIPKIDFLSFKILIESFIRIFRIFLALDWFRTERSTRGWPIHNPFRSWIDFGFGRFDQQSEF